MPALSIALVQDGGDALRLAELLDEDVADLHRRDALVADLLVGALVAAHRLAGLLVVVLLVLATHVGFVVFWFSFEFVCGVWWFAL